jgi:four helix bundle protein
MQNWEVGMAAIIRFEDLEAWQLSRELARRIYQVSSRGELSRDPALRNQIRRAAVSVLSNIAEGFERDGNKEFHQFLSIAKGSLGEVRAQLYVALDAGLLAPEEFRELNQLATQIGKVIHGLMRYLNRSDLKGAKFKEAAVLYSVEVDLQPADPE